jgi:hypothetical protein
MAVPHGEEAMSNTTQLFYVTAGGTTADNTITDLTLSSGTIVSSTTVSQPGAALTGDLLTVDLVPQDGIYFLDVIANGDSTASVYEEHAGEAVSFSSAAFTVTETNNVHTDSLGVDTQNNIVYYTDGTSLYAEHFGSDFSGTPTKTDLGSLVQSTSITPTGALVYDQQDNTAYYAGVASSIYTTFSGTTGSITANYIYKVSGLTKSATASSVSISDAVKGGAQVPLSDGIVKGMALDTATDTLYFTTIPTPGYSGTTDAGLYALALSGANEGEITTIWAEAITSSNTSSAYAQMGSLTIDSVTGEYYIATTTGTLGEAGDILVGNVGNIGTAPAVLEATNTTADGENGTTIPAGLAVDPGISIASVSVLAVDGHSGVTSGVLTTADTVTFAVTLNEPASISGTPDLTLNDGGTATYVSGSGTDVLVFTYTPQAGQNTATLAVTSEAGSITDDFGAGLINTLSATFSGLHVDTTPPSLTLTGTSSDALQGGGSITALASTPIITDSTGTGTLTGATIAIASPKSGDVLGINGATSGTLDGGAITFSDSSGSSLVLSGSASLAEYEAALAEVTYLDGGTDTTTSGNPVRTLDWSVSEGALTSTTHSTSITILRPLTLSAGGTVTLHAGGAVTLDSSIKITDLDNDSVSSATISIGSGFTSGDTLNFVTQNGITGSYDAADGVLTLTGTASAAAYQVALASITLSNSNADPTNGGTDTLRSISYVVGDAAGESNSQSSEADVVCYLRGTQIVTARGIVPVETLAIGEHVVTRSGGLRPIKWLGHQRFQARFLRGNRAKIPVRIAVGALGDGLPLRDLFVSPGHSMLIGETLILARNLVNGVTITQDELPDEVHYIHIELDTHNCILAEGAWSESYTDAPGMRTQFQNETEFWALYPDYVTPPEIVTCHPRPEHGPALAQALAPIVARAAEGGQPGELRGWVDVIHPGGLIEGWAQDLAHPELPVLLEIWLGEERLGAVLACDPRDDLRQAGIGQGHCSFAFASNRGFTTAEMAQIEVRRASDEAVLGFTETLRQYVQAA